MTRHGPLTWAAIVTAIATGCVSYQPAPVDLAAQADSLSARRLSDPGLESYLRDCKLERDAAQSTAEWGFERLIAAALYFSPALAQARAEVGAAEAAALAAGLRQDPSLGLTGEYRYSGTDGAPPATWGPTLELPITTAGKRGIRQAEAAARLQEAQLRLGETAWQARSRLRWALAAREGAAAEAAVLEDLAAARCEALTVLEARLTAGEASQPDVEAARAEAEQSSLALIQSRRSLAEAEAALAAALGLPREAIVGVEVAPLPLELPEDPAGPEARVRALTSRTDLLAALAAYAAREQAVRLAVAGQYPDLKLSPGLLYDQGAQAWTLGASFLLPILNRNRGEIARAEADRELEAAKVLALQESVLHDLDAARASYAISRQAVVQARAQQATRDATLAAVARSVEAGQDDRLALALAHTGREAARLDVARAQAGAQQALGRLEDALQVPLSPAAALPPLPQQAPPSAAPEATVQGSSR